MTDTTDEALDALTSNAGFLQAHLSSLVDRHVGPAAPQIVRDQSSAITALRQERNDLRARLTVYEGDHSDETSSKMSLGRIEYQNKGQTSRTGVTHCRIFHD